VGKEKKEKKGDADCRKDHWGREEKKNLTRQTKGVQVTNLGEKKKRTGNKEDEKKALKKGKKNLKGAWKGKGS